MKEDDERKDVAHDIFGRERFRAYRDDMQGVGSFMKENKTLHIVGFKSRSVNNEMIIRHFQEWGDLEYTRVLWDKSVIFVKYRLRSAAEFAKEAMTDQSLDGDEVLVLRWSHENPNEVAQKFDETKTLIEVAKQISAQVAKEDPVYQYSEEVFDHFPSKQDPSLYPNTDKQQVDENQNSSDSAFVTEWLTTLELQQYVPFFLNFGFNIPYYIKYITSVSLDTMEITNEQHRKKILDEAPKIKIDPEVEKQYQDYFSQYAVESTSEKKTTSSKEEEKDEDDLLNY